MAPSNPGGRPKNNWNSSRRRKLVRLYTLTTISLDEVRQVLRAHDFNPSESDIQKRLRELFPRDFRNEWRQYRPKNGNLMTVRFKKLEEHRRARKSRLTRLAMEEQAQSPLFGDSQLPPKDPYQAFEGPLSAFRSYAGNHSAFANCAQLSLSAPPSESQLVVPSLLLLDGSSVAGATVNTIRSSATAANQSSTDHPVSAPSLGRSHSPTHHSSVVSLQSLEAKLVRRSSSVIQHIHSVLRYSSTNSWRSSASWRSSWISFGSRMSIESGISLATSSSAGTPKISSAGMNNISSEDGSHRMIAAPGIAPANSQNQLSKDMKGIWAELAAHKLPSTTIHRRRPVSYETACKHTACRYARGHDIQKFMVEKNFSVCVDCGISPVHLVLLRSAGGEEVQKLPVNQIRRKDYLDNGPLHFAARAERPNPDVFIKLIGMGADIHSVTTSGATFLHVLFWYLKPKYLSKFIPLLRHLAALKFSFSRRDYWGRQPFSVLLGGIYVLGVDYLADFAEAFTVMQPDIDTMDTLGFSVRRFFRYAAGKGKIKVRAGEVLFQRPMLEPITTDFQVALSKLGNDWTAWIKWLSIEPRSVWIDGRGNTALIAMLKYWGSAQDERILDTLIKEMVELGSQIHIRDRHGDTALGIAAERGLRPAVKTLTELGASIHSVNLRGISILSNARKGMRQARQKEDDNLHAMIWSCIIYLVDLKACEFPTLRRQHWATWAPDSHFPWDDGREKTSEEISRLLTESGLV